MVTHYEDIDRVYTDNEYFSNSGTGEFQRLIGENFRSIPLAIDPPEHSKYRMFLMPYFSPARISRDLEPRIRNVVVEMIEAIAPQGEVDMAWDFARVFAGAVEEFLRTQPILEHPAYGEERLRMAWDENQSWRGRNLPQCGRQFRPFPLQESACLRPDPHGQPALYLRRRRPLVFGRPSRPARTAAAARGMVQTCSRIPREAGRRHQSKSGPAFHPESAARVGRKGVAAKLCIFRKSMFKHDGAAILRMSVDRTRVVL